MATNFPETELILNKDGSVYHLNLLPEDIGDTVITVGDPDRVPLISRFFESIDVKKQKREFVTHTGKFNGKRLTVLSSGIGTDNVEIVFNELDALVNIDLKRREPKSTLSPLRIVRVGTSGALQADIEPDSFVFSQFGLGFDGLLHFYKSSNDAGETTLLNEFISYYGEKKNIAKPYLYRCSSELERRLGEGMFKGITVTCSGFYAPQGRILRYTLSHEDAIDKLPGFRSSGVRITNFEMETSAMYGLGRILGHEVCAVNAIVANRLTKRHTKKPEETMDKLIKTVLERLTA